MLLNLTDVLTSEGKVEEQSVPIEMSVFESKMGDYPIIEKEPLTLIMKNLGVGKVMIDGKLKLTLMMNCARCLKEVPKQLVLEFSREIISPDATKEDNDDDDQNFMEGYQLNIESLVNNEILINLPFKVLCKPDCKGICRQCGQDLNLGECGCDTFVPDPRMAAIKDIFNANKEV